MNELIEEYGSGILGCIAAGGIMACFFLLCHPGGPVFDVVVDFCGRLL